MFDRILGYFSRDIGIAALSPASESVRVSGQ